MPTNIEETRIKLEKMMAQCTNAPSAALACQYLTTFVTHCFIYRVDVRDFFIAKNNPQNQGIQVSDPNQCPYCPKKFKGSYGTKAHISKAHKDKL